MLGALSIDTYLPAMPAIARDFAASPFATQQTLSLFLFGYAFMTLFYGTLSDSFGRRPVILGSLGVYLGASLGCALAPNLGWLLAFRLLQGFSAGAGNVVGRAMVGDLFTGVAAQRMMAFISLVFGIAPALAPILGGWLQSALGWRAIFLFVAAFTLVVMIICLRSLPESLEAAQRHPFQVDVILSNYWKVGGHGRFILMCLGNALAFSGVSIYIGAAPAFVYSILHLSAHDFGWLFIPLIGGMTLGGAMAARLSHRLSPDTIIRIGFAVMALAAVANVAYSAEFLARVPWAVVAPFVYCVGMAFSAPAMNVLLLEKFPKTRGLASSLMAFTFMIIFATASGLLCPLLNNSALNLALGICVGLALSILCWTLGVRGRHEHAPTPLVETPEEVPFDL